MSISETTRPNKLRKREKRRTARRILRRRAVEERTGLKTSSIYEKVAEGTFPKPIPLGERAVGWIEDEVEAWIEKQIAARDVKVA